MTHDEKQINALNRIAFALEAIAAALARLSPQTLDEEARSDDTNLYGPIVEPNSWGLCPACRCRLIDKAYSDDNLCPVCGAELREPEPENKAP